jgi:hypothetical protein
MANLTLKRSWSADVLWILTVLLVTVVSGCRFSSAPPKAPKVRIEGPPGTPLGYSVSYFDDKGGLDATGEGKVIPESGVYAEDLQGGHQGVLVQVTPQRAATVTVILLDGTREIQRATVQADKELAQVKAGKVNVLGPFPR